MLQIILNIAGDDILHSVIDNFPGIVFTDLDPVCTRHPPNSVRKLSIATESIKLYFGAVRQCVLLW